MAIVPKQSTQRPMEELTSVEMEKLTKDYFMEMDCHHERTKTKLSKFYRVALPELKGFLEPLKEEWANKA